MFVETYRKESPMRRIVIPLVLALGLPVSAQADEVVVFAAAEAVCAALIFGAFKNRTRSVR